MAPWEYDLPQDFRDELIKTIVSFDIEVEVERIEGKFKLSQNRSDEDYESVVKEFSQLSVSNSQELLR